MPLIENFRPSADTASYIEDLVLKAKNSTDKVHRWGYGALSRVISFTAFPAALATELMFKQVPKLLSAAPLFRADQKTPDQFHRQVDKIIKKSLGIFFSPLGVIEANGVSSLFLKQPPDSVNQIRPFGVEELFGKQVEKIHYPESVEELQNLVRQAKAEKKHISIIGAGMSQGTQTVTVDAPSIVINTKKLKHLEFGASNRTVKAQAGAIWEDVQVEANKRGKSVIVKQASDIFSVGGSIGINCHGWAHEYGAIASTIESLEIIDANGDLRTLKPTDEQFGCMFGTLGYFGVVVSATLKLVDNEYLTESTAEVGLYEFMDCYKREIKGKDIPLFGGRLTLDHMEGNPLRRVYMVKYEKDKHSKDGSLIIDEGFKPEPTYGTRVERVFLQAITYLPHDISRRLISKFWTQEREAMLKGRRITRNEALHPNINAFNMLRKSKISAEWLQEYFIKEANLPNFLAFLGAQLKAYNVPLINATIRPTPKDEISVLPYAEQDRYAVVICFPQLKTEENIKRTREWMDSVNQYVISQGDIYYQAYMPFHTKEDFEKAYGPENVAKMRQLKQKYDPENRFLNAHTAKYFDHQSTEGKLP